MITILIPNRKREWRAAVILMMALIVAACGPTSDQTQGPKVVATTSIWGDVVASLVGEDGSVEVLIPIGADAHDYQPSPGQVTSMQEADLVVANGLGLEEGLEEVLTQASEDGANVVEMAPALDPVPLGVEAHDPHDEETGEEEEGGHEDKAGLDPHIWHDPVRMADAARLLADELAKVDDSIDWAARAETYSAKLLETHDEIDQILSVIPAERRLLVTNHEALGYFADRYGFTVVGVIIPGGSTLAEPSSAELAELVHVIEREEVPAIFAETSHPTDLAQAVAAEVGREVSVVEIHTESLGGPESEAATLPGMLLANAKLIAAALDV